MFLNTRRITRYNLYLCWCIATGSWLLLTVGCTTREAGCLDPNASNFDLSAEKACSSCCTYPVMTVSLSQKWGSRNFNVTDTLYDAQQKPYLIQDLKYFLSSWSWQDAQRNLYTVDSAELLCGDALIRYSPDILIVDSKQFQYTLGTIRLFPSIDSIFMTGGLGQDLGCLDPAASTTPPSLGLNSPLRDAGTGNLNAIRLVLKRNPQVETLDTLYIQVQEPFAVAYPFAFTRGMNAVVSLTVDYLAWFSAVDADQLSSFETSVRAGLQGSIFATP